LLLTAAVLWPAMATAADAPAADKSGPKAKSKQTAKDPAELPELEQLGLATSDGLELAITYYPGTKGKETIPIVLLHGFKQSRNDFKDLAPALQAFGCAVIVPDLRGHGESTRLKTARRDETLKATTMTPAQFGMMVTRDMEAVKTFLWERNNAGELNIDKLCVVGAEMGASVALNFAIVDAIDQNRNRVLRPEYKIGNFVKAIVLLSPELTFRGLPIRTGQMPLLEDIAVMILVGKQDVKAMEEAKRIWGILERYHPDPTGDNAMDKRTLFYLPIDTKLQGTKLLDPKLGVGIELHTRSEGTRKFGAGIAVQDLILDFLERRLIKNEESREWTWRERKLPHG
jgi:pimeloyl-ACP methyl ester carboxylesterase